ncbi:helix-turn-helix domain-containing protein [Vibrio sp. JC009]|uniref:helix-turn-helix transcriptional regulator n=1 Tax=Vibrio sp. JC009 TaxID=2912314 RepID=UPI0023AE8005|nr:helix-turn-helix domain-containing protein [Vibrio sp. JC009]WED22032.1 helix-turn-helix domain-containing protein [Vibrio sp. JC009]
MKNQSADETIRKIKAKQQASNVSAVNEKEVTYTVNPQSRQRASKDTVPMDAQRRKIAMDRIIKKVLLGEITQGQALKALRVEVLGLRQDSFAEIVSVSRKTLSEVENDKGNYTSEIINKLFKPFGLQMGLVPTSRHRLLDLLSD